MATKGLAEASMDRNCLEVNMGSSLPSPSQVYHPLHWTNTLAALFRYPNITISSSTSFEGSFENEFANP